MTVVGTGRAGRGAAFDDTGWLFLPAPLASPRVRLFCFPYAGGFSWEFRSWGAQLGADIEVGALCMPGRGDRRVASPPRSLAELADAVADAIAPRLDRPYALFGHSFGALVAFEVAGELERRGARAPARLFASAAVAPDEDHTLARLHALPDRELLDALSALHTEPDPLLMNPGVAAATLPLVRADLALVAEYRPRRAAISTPITALYGAADPSTPRAAVEGWRRATRAALDVHEISGDHFFLKPHAATLLALITSALA